MHDQAFPSRPQPQTSVGTSAVVRDRAKQRAGRNRLRSSEREPPAESAVGFNAKVQSRGAAENALEKRNSTVPPDPTERSHQETMRPTSSTNDAHPDSRLRSCQKARTSEAMVVAVRTK